MSNPITTTENNGVDYDMYSLEYYFIAQPQSNTKLSPKSNNNFITNAN